MAPNFSLPRRPSPDELRKAMDAQRPLSDVTKDNNSGAHSSEVQLDLEDWLKDHDGS